MKWNNRGLIGCLLAVACAGTCAARDVGVLVSGIGSGQGEIECRLYSGENGFPYDDGDLVQTVRYPAGAELITCTFPGVEPGRYAVSVLHDENGNGTLDKSFMGFPKEAWGVSNNVRPQRRSPRFLEASVSISEDRLASFEIVLGR
jgi:uncharacterized protein (DUF2141 family)